MKLVKITLVLLVLSLAGCISWVFAKSPFNDMPEGNYTLDLAHASIVWKVSHFGLSNYVARFAEFDASINFDPNDFSKSQVTATINPMSIQTAYPFPEKEDFNQILATEKGWFNATEFPSINFVSRSIELTSDKTAIMLGDLSFLGLTKPVSLNVIFNGAMPRQPFTGKPTMGFSASTTIIRSEFGMDKYISVIGDSVEVMIEGEFTLNK